MTDRTIDDLLGEPAAETTGTGLPSDVDSVTLASLLGLTANRVSVLGREGVLPRRQIRGAFRYLLPDAVVAYVDWARDNPRGRRTRDSNLNDEKLRLAKEQADKISIQNARARGELLEAAEVARRWIEYTTALRASLLAVPARVASQTGLDRPAAAALDSELRAALGQIADGATETPDSGPLTGESPTSGSSTPETVDDAQEAAE